MNWERLSLPKLVGGWGLKNTFHFVKALAAKSLWTGFVAKSIWSDIVHAKYLRRGSFLD